MREVTIKIYKFDELNNKAKEKAREWWRRYDSFGWDEDWRKSLEAFCDRFGVELLDWSVAPYGHAHAQTDASNKHFRGLRKAQVERDVAPTGYCGDSDFSFAFHDEFHRTGDALQAFRVAISAGMKSWQADWEYSLSDEAVDDGIRANEYEFTEDGGFYA